MPMTPLIQSLFRERKEQQPILYERGRRDDEARRDGGPVVDEHAQRVRELSVRLEHLESRKLLGEDVGHELLAARDELEAAKYHAEHGTPLAIARVEDALRIAKAEAEAEAVRESSAARQARPVRPVQASRQPTAAENWQRAGAVLAGASWREWDPCNARLGDGFTAGLVSREDRAFVRRCMVDGGQSLVDAERR